MLVPDRTTSLLLVTSVVTALFHTLIPDHWLPFVLIGRARRWSAGTTALVSGVSALLHTALSVFLGVAALRIGIEAAHLVGERLERASGWLLLVFGTAYVLWAWRKGGHFHPGGSLLHAHGGPDCDGQEGDAHPEHLYYHADGDLIRGGGADRSAFYLAAIVGLNPCVLVMPVMLATAEKGAAALALVTLAYSVTTTVCMMGLSVAGVVGSRRFSLPWGARYMEMGSGALIALVGVVLLILQR
jgi:ABC-type nickel/cobalt efflux system permease component RcnA